MLMKDCSTELLDLEDVIITNVQNTPGQLH